MSLSSPSPVAAEGAGQGIAQLSARGLGRVFGYQRALHGVEFDLTHGTFLALFGPNGAGKSTLLRILSGALSPTEGELLEDGTTLNTRSADWQRRVGVLSHHGYLYGHLTARENLRFFGRLYEIDNLDDRVAERLEAVGLTARADTAAKGFSRGMRQRLSLARTLLHDPSVVLLDEPFTGLDAHASSVLRDVLDELRDGARTVVMVTHNLSEGLRMADTVAIQVNGRIAHWGAIAEVEQDFESFYRQTVERDL